jgi:hypothetical protein
MEADDGLTLRLDRADASECDMERQKGLVTMLFGLSLATALPAAGMLAPVHVVRPLLRSDAAIVGPSGLAAALGRPVAEVWRGRIALGEVDERLGGLEILLDVLQVTGRGTGLVCLSAVSIDPAAPGGGATPSTLWDLALAALVNYGTPHTRPIGIGEDSFLADYGGVTAQVAWMTGDRLATASATCLDGEQGWSVKAARSVAIVLDRCLRSRSL